MHITTIVKATSEEVASFFKFDEVLNIRCYEKIGENRYKMIIRIPECGIRVRNGTTLNRIKQKVLELCEDTFPIQRRVFFKDGTKRIIYAGSSYWEEEYAKRYAEYSGTKIDRIERIKGDDRV